VVLELLLLVLIYRDVDLHEASLLTLENVQVEVFALLIRVQALKRLLLDQLHPITWIKQIQILLALLGQDGRDVTALMEEVLHGLAQARQG
jgi:hypothetical protein